MYFPSPCVTNLPHVDNSPQAERRRINRDYQQFLLNDLRKITNMDLEDIVHKFNNGWRLVSLEDIETHHIRGDKVFPPIPFKHGQVIVR